MPHFFVAPEAVADGRVSITGPDVRHIARVLRMGPGDYLTVSDGRFFYRVEIRSVRRQEVEAVVHEQWEAAVEPRYRVRLVQGVPKGDKMDSVVRQATEVGAVEIVPLLSRYVIPERAPEVWDRRVERWRRIAREAAKSSGRAVVPRVREPAGWEEVLALLGPGTLGILPWEQAAGPSLRQLLHRHPLPRDIYVLIGPEGGFATEEVERARAAGALIVSLGPRLLRTETAGPLTVGLILYEVGDMGG